MQAGPWLADTPFNRGTLESVLEAGNYARGPGSYWLEVQASVDAVVSTAVETNGYDAGLNLASDFLIASANTAGVQGLGTTSSPPPVN